MPARDKELRHSSVAVNVLNCVPQKQKKTFAEICKVHDNQLFSKIIRNPCHILNLNFRQFLQLQKTTTSDHANIIDCFQNVGLLHVSLMLILFTEIFIVINDCAVTTIFTISFFRCVNLFI